MILLNLFICKSVFIETNMQFSYLQLVWNDAWKNLNIIWNELIEFEALLYEETNSSITQTCDVKKRICKVVSTNRQICQFPLTANKKISCLFSHTGHFSHITFRYKKLIGIKICNGEKRGPWNFLLTVGNGSFELLKYFL